MKIALLGSGFGQAHATICAHHTDVGEVAVFGCTAEKLTKISDELHGRAPKR